MSTRPYPLILILVILLSPVRVLAADLFTSAILYVDIDPCTGAATYQGTHSFTVSNLLDGENNKAIFLDASIENCSLPWNNFATTREEAITGAIGSSMTLTARILAVRLCSPSVNGRARTVGGFIGDALGYSDGIAASGCILASCSLPHEDLEYSIEEEGPLQ